MIKSSECCCYPRTTNLRSSKAGGTGRQTYSTVTDIYTIASESNSEKKLSNVAFSAFGGFGTRSQKELQVLGKALQQIRVPRDHDPTSHHKPTQRASTLAISTTRPSFFFKGKESPTQSNMPQTGPQGRGRAGLPPVSQPTPPPPQPRQNPPLAIGVAVDLCRAPGTSHICVRGSRGRRMNT